MVPMKTIAIYVRISTTDQNTEGQVQELQAWLDRSGLSPQACEWYVDRESGTKIDRTHLNRLQAAINAGQIRTVVCWKLDRLSRDMLEGMNLVAAWVDRGVRVVSTTQAIDVSGTMGKIMASMLFGFAQIETEYRRERQRAGIAAAKQRGVYKGRKAGTTKGRPSRAVDLQRKGLTLAEIAQSMGCTSRTVRRYLVA